MEDKIKGSWLVHHTNKLQLAINHSGYDSMYAAGKAGILLSAISSEKQSNVSKNKLNTLAQAANINKIFELPKIIEILKAHKLIDETENGISVLGVTTPSVLLHSASIFESLTPSKIEQAQISLAERASKSPIYTSDVSEEISDHYNLSNRELTKLFNDAENIGFVDIEDFGENKKLMFNGNLFRRERTEKIKKLLDTLNQEETNRLNELSEMLKKSACISTTDAERVLGSALYEKINSIGVFDINVVSNSNESVGFLTLPSAFCKYSNSMIEDAFDLAKAFVSSVTYGMTKSRHERGKIQMVDALLSTLVNGEKVGPVRAIAEDYKVLELKGVVRVTEGSKNGRTGPMLELLKKEVGQLALQAIRSGDVSEHSLKDFPTAAITSFHGPEHNRENVRKRQLARDPETTHDMLHVLRTGGGL